MVLMLIHRMHWQFAFPLMRYLPFEQVVVLVITKGSLISCMHTVTNASHLLLLSATLSPLVVVPLSLLISPPKHYALIF